MTAALWVRGMLAEEYGVMPSDIVWRTGGLEQPGRYGAFRLDLPPEIEVRPLPPERSLSAMLAAGELPALVSARAPSCFGAGDGPVRRLFPDYRAAEEAYYRKSGLYPIMHLVAMRESLAEAHPWLPASLYKAFLRSKNMAVAALGDVTAPHVSLPWIAAEYEAMRALLGPDIWPYGFEDNLRVSCRRWCGTPTPRASRSARWTRPSCSTRRRGNARGCRPDVRPSIRALRALLRMRGIFQPSSRVAAKRRIEGRYASQRSRFAATKSSSARSGWAARTRSISSAWPGLSVSAGSRHQMPSSRP